MANARGKTIDNTHLSIDQAETRGFIHRDYIAHCLRWSHVVKIIQKSGFYTKARIMDVGCGKDLPLAKTLYSSRLIVQEYVGVDYNKHESFDVSPFHTGKFPVSSFGRVDFASNQVWFDRAADGQPLLNIKGDNHEDYFKMPNVFVSFEVMEHIEPYHVRAMLLKIRQAMELTRELDNEYEPVFFLSTPNYDRDVGHAANHVNEMRHDALGWLLEESGFQIKNRYGTFASMRDYKYELFKDHPAGQELFNKLSDYYDVNYLATIFAPLYPSLARNCLWQLVLPKDGHERSFPDRPHENSPWTSSESWRDLDPASGVDYDPSETGIGKMANKDDFQ